MATRPTAVIDIPHMEGERSCKLMLETAGYDVYGIGRDVRHLLAYMPLRSSSRIKPFATLNTFDTCNLFAVVKHFAVAPTLKRFPRLEGRVLWFGINAGKPGVPIVSAPYKMNPLTVPVPYVGAVKWYSDDSPLPVAGPRYFAYLPLVQQHLYRLRTTVGTAGPICLIHAARRWGGYGWMVDRVSRLGVRFYGNGCPAGCLTTSQVRQQLAGALCYVHLKSHDCPGYSLYEAMLTGCPVVLPSQFLDMTGYHNLYEHEKTCLVIDDQLRDKSEERAQIIERGVVAAVERLRDPEENRRIGSNGRARLLQLMWNAERDGPSFQRFINTHFPGTT